MKLAVGLFMSSVGLLCLVWGWGQFIFAFLSLLLLGGGLYFLRLTVVDWEIEEHELLQTLREHPERIVWVYSVVTQRMPFGFEFSNDGILFFKLMDGNTITIDLPARELKQISESLNRLLPHATFGFTKDREQWYMASPELLRRDNEGMAGR